MLGGYRNVLPEQPWSGTSLLRGVDAGQVCAAECVAPADFIEMGRHYYSQVTWSHSTYTLHQYTILTFVLPPEVATTASQYQTLSISRLWKLYFVPSASRDHFWQHLRLKLQLKVKTKREDVKIWKSIIEETSFWNWMFIRDQQRYLLVPNTKHSKVKLYKLDNVGRISCYGMKTWDFPSRRAPNK